MHNISVEVRICKDGFKNNNNFLLMYKLQFWTGEQQVCKLGTDAASTISSEGWTVYKMESNPPDRLKVAKYFYARNFWWRSLKL